MEGSSKSNGFDGSIITSQLTSTNYWEWAQAMRLAVAGRGKLDILIGETKAPTNDDSAAKKKWVIDNAIVSSWLVNSMVPQLRKSFMYLPTAFEIWEAVRMAYTDKNDLSLIFDIKRKIWKSFQGSRSVTDYWLELIGLW